MYRRAGQEFMEARRSAGLSTAPPCLWSPSPPLELKGAPAHALDANSGFVSFGTPLTISNSKAEDQPLVCWLPTLVLSPLAFLSGPWGR